MSRSPPSALETNDSVALDSLVSSPFWAVDTWLWGLVAIGLCTWVSVPRQYRAVVPLGLALPWLVASFSNVTLILQR